MTTPTQSVHAPVNPQDDRPFHPNPNYPPDFETAARNLITAFPNPDLCETLAMKSLETATCVMLHIERTCPEFHPYAAEDPEIRRAYLTAERSYLRFLSYLHRRLDHRARLAARAANPSDAYAATLYKPDSQYPATPAPTPPPTPTPTPAPAVADCAAPTPAPTPAPDTTSAPTATVPPSPPQTPANTPRTTPSNSTQVPAKTQVVSSRPAPASPRHAASPAHPLPIHPHTASHRPEPARS